MQLIKNRKPLWVVAILMIGATSFLVARQVTTRGAATAQTPPGGAASPIADNVTPPPGATPDRSQPYWYVPYLNRDRDLPKFSGDINGIHIGSAAIRPEAPTKCAGQSRAATGDEAARLAALGPLAIPKVVTDQLRVAVPLVVSLCDDLVVAVVEYFDAPAGRPGVNVGGGAVEIRRELGTYGVGLDEAAERWTAGNIHGRPAALLAPVVDTFGTTAVVVTSQAGGSPETTLVRGAGVTLDFVIKLAEELYR